MRHWSFNTFSLIVIIYFFRDFEEVKHKKKEKVDLFISKNWSIQRFGNNSQGKRMLICKFVPSYFINFNQKVQIKVDKNMSPPSSPILNDHWTDK